METVYSCLCSLLINGMHTAGLKLGCDCAQEMADGAAALTSSLPPAATVDANAGLPYTFTRFSVLKCAAWRLWRFGCHFRLAFVQPMSGGPYGSAALAGVEVRGIILTTRPERSHDVS